MPAKLQNERTEALPPTPPTTDRLPVTVPIDTPRASVFSTPAGYPLSDHVLTPGRLFGGYQVLEEVASGGMGIVYRARDPVLNRIVALKMLRFGEVATESQKLRFYREAQAAAQLNHPHIVPIFEIGEQEGQPYFSMALCTGGSLKAHLERYHADPRAAVALTEKVARAVHYAHGKGVLHRDLKPSNILLDEHGEPQVSDFGIAKLAGVELELTTPGMMLGTPVYMSPEQAAADGSPVTAQSDVWSLGVMLYELLTARRPFQAESSEELWRNIRNDEPTRPSMLRRLMDRNLETVILKCLEKSPARRYASAEALAEDLRRWLNGEPVLARPRAWPVRTYRKLRRHRYKTTAALVAIVALIAGMVVPSLLDPDRALKANELKLAAGKPVTLIAATGPPARSHSPLNQGAEVVSADGVFSVTSFDSCLLELLPPHPRQSFRFSGEVRHDDERGVGVIAVGLYFGRRAVTSPQGDYHCFSTLTFDDKSPQKNHSKSGRPLERMVGLQVRRDSHARGTSNAGPLIYAPFNPARAAGQKDVWRRLALEVTPDQTSVFWEGQLIGVASRNDLNQRMSTIINGPDKPAHVPDMPPGFEPEGGVGLYVLNGAASFRNVVIESLPR